MGFSIEVVREMFGHETLGLRDFQIMSAGPSCQECGDVPASYTLNFDVLGDAESVPVCDKCGPLVEAKVSQDVASIGRTTIFGRNGWGRG